MFRGPTVDRLERVTIYLKLQHRQQLLVPTIPTMAGSHVVNSSDVNQIDTDVNRNDTSIVDPTPSASSSILPSSSPVNSQDLDSLAYQDWANNPYMARAFGKSLLQSTSVPLVRPMFGTTVAGQVIANLGGKHYSLPGGAVGRKYVNQLSAEIMYLSTGSFSSLVFSSVISLTERPYCPKRY